MQVVLQVRVRPGRFEIRNGTLANKHWPPDLPFDDHHRSSYGLEWLVEDEADVVVVGLLVRELGKGAEPSVYGETASRVRRMSDSRGPEFAWCEERAQKLRMLMMRSQVEGG